MDWENHLEKNSGLKNRKHSKNQSEIAASEQKNHYRETEFLFKHRFLTLLYAAKALAFSLHFQFRRDQNHYSNLFSKIMKMCEQILEKKTAPQYNSNSLNCNNRK